MPQETATPPAELFGNFTLDELEALYKGAEATVTRAPELDLIERYRALQQQIKDYEDVLADKRRLTRELDVILSGGPDRAARQASLCDLIPTAHHVFDLAMLGVGLYSMFHDNGNNGAYIITEEDVGICLSINGFLNEDGTAKENRLVPYMEVALAQSRARQNKRVSRETH